MLYFPARQACDHGLATTLLDIPSNGLAVVSLIAEHLLGIAVDIVHQGRIGGDIVGLAGLGLQGVIRGKPIKTTTADRAAPCPLDHVNRQFHAPAPNMLWLSDFTYVSTWAGFVYVAFVIDAYARRIVGWR